ncbi:MAG: cytosine deaminase [Hyphomonadaceae bacterium]
MSAWPDAPRGGGFVLRDASAPAALWPGALAGADIVRVDIAVADGAIRFVAPAGAGIAADWASFPMAGGMVWPCFVDAHAHLECTQTWARTPNPDGSFPGALGAYLQDRERWTPQEVRARMEFALACAYAHGTRAIRTHLAPRHDTLELYWEVFRDARAAWAGRVDLQGAALVSPDDVASDAALARICAVLRESGGVLGAFATAAPDVEASLARVFDAAERYGLALDFHADETSNAASRGLSHIARLAIARRFARPILVGHCCSIALQPADEIDRTLDLVAEAGLSIVSLPSCNLYLQDRQPARTPRWRGVTLLHEMRARGVAVAIGGDNCRDPYYAYGDYDMLEVFRDAARIAHLDHPFGDWPRAVTQTPSTIVGAPRAGFAVGDPADFVLFRARTFNELLARPQADRRLIRSGAFVEPALPDYAALDALTG